MGARGLSFIDFGLLSLLTGLPFAEKTEKHFGKSVLVARYPNKIATMRKIWVWLHSLDGG